MNKNNIFILLFLFIFIAACKEKKTATTNNENSNQQIFKRLTASETGITFSNNINEEQKERLLIIAEKCPVSKILKNKITINTTL